MAERWTPPDSAPVALPEPQAALLAFLSDLSEQVALFRAQCGGDQVAGEILDALDRKITALGLIVAQPVHDRQ